MRSSITYPHSLLKKLKKIHEITPKSTINTVLFSLANDGLKYREMIEKGTVNMTVDHEELLHNIQSFSSLLNEFRSDLSVLNEQVFLSKLSDKASLQMMFILRRYIHETVGKDVLEKCDDTANKSLLKIMETVK